MCVAFSPHVAPLTAMRGPGEEIQCRGLPRAHLYLQIPATPGRVVPALSAGSSSLNVPKRARPLRMRDVWTYDHVGPLLLNLQLSPEPKQ